MEGRAAGSAGAAPLSFHGGVLVWQHSPSRGTPGGMLIRSVDVRASIPPAPLSGEQSCDSERRLRAEMSCRKDFSVPPFVARLQYPLKEPSLTKKKKTNQPRGEGGFFRPGSCRSRTDGRTHACSSTIQPGGAAQMCAVTHQAARVTRRVTQLSSCPLPCLFRMLERWPDHVPRRASASARGRVDEQRTRPGMLHTRLRSSI